MKTNYAVFTGIFCLFIPFILGNQIYAQESVDQKSQQLDLKLQLLDSKLDLLDSKIKLWEAKPEELDIRLDEIDKRIRNLEFDPAELNALFWKTDSMVRELNKINTLPVVPESYIREEEPEQYYQFKSAILLNPIRLFEGTFHLTYERLLADKLSLCIAGLATYATEEGLTSYFFSNQEFNYYDISSDSWIDYHGESLAGGGIILQCKNYLLSDYPSRRKAPLGLYAAPEMLYRRILITGEHMEYIEDKWVKKEIKQRLNIFSSGVMLGAKIPFMKVLFIDLYVGGNIRFSKYDKSAGLTKYKKWYNIDFSGVFPTAGIGIGILK